MIRNISTAIFGIGFLLFLSGSFQLISNQFRPVRANDIGVTSSTERSATIKAAKAAGKKDYSFVTHFTPGIGVIANPEQYRSDYLNQIQESIKTNQP